MLRRPPRFTRTDTLLPYTPLVQAAVARVRRTAGASAGRNAAASRRRAAAPSRSARAHGHAVPRAGIVAVLRLLAGPIRHLAVRHHRRPRRQPEATAGRTARTAQRTALLARPADRSDEPTSELPSLMRISYAVFCLK